MTHKTLGTSFIALGALVVTIGSQMSLSASMTSQGTYLGTQQAGEPMWINQEVLLPAATIESSNPAGVLAFGMLMMLVGFGLHALWTIRKNDEQMVPVKQASKKKISRTSRKQMEVIWVERTIRL
ncbi:MAG: hypothetical protein HOG89_04130 [Candidatus Peribacter sp.]|jgi:hypothetical protein|nr:hypothetical protein [Candidatus Peribacter sp.]MBT4393356.1 hypothetical protein [Candidatus Peribacter sp.]MBT4600805.1 hypothetical protein [Candidatus Peribacter sp.]MBT5149149.1 hypothetical protein [Candidatus Peribacter sp.]MBT5637878.1 hypothetical protein [Candidatus Peribacter sp.]